MTYRYDKGVILKRMRRRRLQRRGSGANDRFLNLYLWVFDDGTCYQVRDLGTEEKLDTIHRGVRDPRRDFSAWLERWNLLEKFSKGTK